MLSLPSAVRLYVAAAPVDMRKGFDSLAALAHSAIGQDPLSGHIFLYYNRRRDRVKALWWDRTGFALLYKRLERGTFPIPRPATSDARSVEIDAGDLALLLEGLDASTGRRTTRWYRTPHEGLAHRNAL